MAGRARPGELRLHVGLGIATVLCVSAFCVELWRATSGNRLSWAYVVEWPVLLAYGVYMWRRMLAEGRGERPRGRAPKDQTDAEAVALDAYNRHLAALHARDARDAGRPDPPRG